MLSRIASATFICLLALMLSACGAAPSQPEVAPAVPTINSVASQALAQAEADVAVARNKFALWSTAESALVAARLAAELGDSEAVIKQAELASELAALGIAQLDYPSTER
jgi:hypothetical protein